MRKRLGWKKDIQAVILKTEYATDNYDLELEEGEIPKCSNFTKTETISENILVGSKICFPPDINKKDLKRARGSLMEKVFGPAFKCNVCDKITKERGGMTAHVETHIEGISYTCHLCGAVTRTSNAHRAHKSRYHKKSQI